MNLRDLRYLLAVAEHRHFGRAAEASGISQPTLSTQIRKLEEELGVALFERGAKSVVPTPVAFRLLAHARVAVDEVDAMVAVARASRDPLSGGFRLGLIPTLAPFLLPLVFAPLRAALPALEIEPWEETTAQLLERLRAHDLDAAVIATEPDGADLSQATLFVEPFLAAMPPEHPLAERERLAEAALLPDMLVMADGHCLRDQVIAACGDPGVRGAAFRAASLSTLMNMVAAGYGTTLIPGLAAGAAEDAGLTLRPLEGAATRTVRMVWRASYPRAAAAEAVAGVVRERLRGFSAAAAA